MCSSRKRHAHLVMQLTTAVRWSGVYVNRLSIARARLITSLQTSIPLCIVHIGRLAVATGPGGQRGPRTAVTYATGDEGAVFGRGGDHGMECGEEVGAVLYDCGLLRGTAPNMLRFAGLAGYLQVTINMCVCVCVGVGVWVCVWVCGCVCVWGGCIRTLPRSRHKSGHGPEC